jgi:hypothetical protein
VDKWEIKNDYICLRESVIEEVQTKGMLTRISGAETSKMRLSKDGTPRGQYTNGV